MEFKRPNIKIDTYAIRTFFKTDRGILLISLGISLVFWLLVKLSKEYKAQREILITYDLPDEMAFVTIPPDKIKIILTGRGWDLMYDYLGNRIRSVSFNLENTKTQTVTNNQLKTKIGENFPSSNFSIEISTDYIPIELGESASKKIPIILKHELNFAPNHQLQSAIGLRPDSIKISGPTSLLTEYNEWPTTLLALRDLKSSIKQPLALQPNDKPQIQLSSTEVQIHIPIEAFTEKSIFLPVMVKNAPDSLKVFPNKVKTSFVVGLSRYDSITEKDFQLEVDLNGVPINQANNTAPIILTKIPSEVKNIHFSPKSVTFLIVKE